MGIDREYLEYFFIINMNNNAKIFVLKEGLIDLLVGFSRFGFSRINLVL
jgi:hypothetical protein